MMVIMMFIHGQSLAIMGILPILFAIFNIHPFIHASPFKTLVDLDVSGPKPTKVNLIPSEITPGGIHYALKPYAMSTHAIGMVRDGQEVLVDEDSTATIRYVFVVTREDGLRYVRIMTRWRIRGNSFRTYVREFLKLTGSPYRELNRDPTDVDILSQEDDQFISVTQSQEGGDQEEPPTIKYTIKSQFWVTNTIGVVRYGHYIINDKVDGLLEREVIWERGVVRPAVTIVSKYDNGTETTVEHVLVDWRGFKVFKYEKRIFHTCE